MKSFLLFVALLGSITSAHAQAILNSWIRNTTGKKGSYYFNNGGMPPAYTFTTSADSADALKVAYTNDSVWVRSHGMTDNLGKWLNPGGVTAMGYTHRFPRTPIVLAAKSVSPKEGAIGLLINGIPIYGLGNATSYNTGTNTNTNAGAKVWNTEVGLSEGFVLDTAFGAHPQQAGAYHTHTTPYRLYKNTPATQHSPLIGFAFDGYPIYGPYGYTSPLDAASGISRMTSGYSLRNITVRTTLPTIPNGGGAASQTGPPVSASFPLGTYCEDYEWLLSNGSTLDRYNGRYCKTPDYPSGTYAYFVTVNASGIAIFPYYIGIQYYGAPVAANIVSAGQASNGLSIPASSVTYVGSFPTPVRLISFTGRAAGAANALAWQFSADELPARQYVQRSNDGSAFEDIALIAAPVGSAAAGHYSFLDENAAAARIYYRLRIIDQQGTESYSATVVLTLNLTGNSFLNIYPTTVAGTLTVEHLAKGVADATICDALGRAVLTRPLSGGGAASIDVSSLQQGMYMLRILQGGVQSTARFFKQ